MRLIGYLLYVAGTRLYYAAIAAASLFKSKAALAWKGRDNLFEKQEPQLKNDPRKKIWFHCASLGEFEQARPLMERIRKTYPEYSIVLTFYSPSGYEVRKNYDGADHIFYMPFDTAANAKRTIAMIDPAAVFFVKYEIWYFHLRELAKKRIPAYLISANFRPDHIYFKWYGAFFRETLKYFTHIFTQLENASLLLKKAGIDNVTVSGDTRYDRVAEHASAVKALPLIAAFKSNEKLLVAGSSYSFEDKLIAEALMNYPDLKVVIAPHETGEERLRQAESIFAGFSLSRYSAGDPGARVMIIDNVGMLNSIYQYADFAFVGGGFANKGLHNILEPMAFGAPVLIGPLNHDKFPEAGAAISAGAAFTITNAEALKTKLDEWLNLPNELHSASSAAKAFIFSQKGATDKVLQHIKLFTFENQDLNN